MVVVADVHLVGQAPRTQHPLARANPIRCSAWEWVASMRCTIATVLGKGHPGERRLETVRKASAQR